MTSEGWQVSAAVWSGDGRPVAPVRLAPPPAGAAEPAQQDSLVAWVRIESDGTTSNVVEGLDSHPAPLISAGRPNEYVEIVDGDLWSVRLPTSPFGA